MDLIRDLQSLDKDDIALAGGKGASLGEIAQAGIPVPPGFVVLSAAFDEFIEETELNVEIDAVLDEVNIKEVHTAANASEKIQAMILSKEMPEGIKREILKNFKKLSAKFVAVRSSATSEDSVSAAWAGQLESYLNTTNEKLLENVKKCWASLFTPRAIFYRFEKKLHRDKISVAVVVQKMVASEESGIAFSVHPVTQDKNQLLIEAGLGLGEAIVSGQITPDSYVIEKDKLNILDKNISEQNKALYKKESGGNEWKELSEEIGKKQVLSDKEITELSKLIIKIENHYGFPVDIEWGKEKGKFYIVQSRPITTLRGDKDPKRIFKKVFNRYMPIYAAQYSYIGKGEGVLKILGDATNFPPLFVNKPGKGVSVYYEAGQYEANSKKTLEYFKKNPSKMEELCNEYKKVYEANNEFIKHAKVKDMKKLFDLNAYYTTPLMTILILVGREEYDEQLRDVAKIARDTRYWNDKLLYITGIKIFELINKRFSLDDDGETADYITIEEALSDKLPSPKEIEERRKSWVLLDEKTLYTGSAIKEFLGSRNIVLEEEENIPKNKKITVIKGKSTQNGHAKGKARIVFTMQDVERVKEGEVMVSPMTGPDFILGIKKAAAIITDEGGITCHAAIISRELKIPCIIGTKIATKVLKDGDVVEVDANSGVVKILK